MSLENDWRADARCATTDAELFFPEKNEHANVAQSICRRCQVTTECLQFAVDNSLHFGVFGGLSANQRKRIRRAS